MTRRRRRTRAAFTLPELLVTISLIAVLGAIVMPAVAGQLRKGDPSRVGSDVAAIRSAAEQFVTDVRRYPAAIQQLTAPITMSMSPLPSTAQAAYGNADVVRWKGPYLTKDSIGAVATGFGWTFKPNFEVDSLAPAGVASIASGQRYVVMKVIMPVKDSMSALSLDSQFDDGNLQTGSIRYRTAPAADTLKFLLLPIS